MWNKNIQKIQKEGLKYLYGDNFFQIQTKYQGFSDQKKDKPKNLTSILYSILLNFLFDLQFKKEQNKSNTYTKTITLSRKLIKM